MKDDDGVLTDAVTHVKVGKYDAGDHTIWLDASREWFGENAVEPTEYVT